MVPSRLKDLEAIEVSLVPKAANKREFLIFKSDRGDDMKDDVKKGINGEEEVKTEETIEKQEEDLQDSGTEKQDVDEIMTALEILERNKNILPDEVLGALLDIIGTIDVEDKIEMETEVDTLDMIAKMDGVSDNVKSMINKMYEDNKAMKEMIEKAEDEKITKDFIEKAKGYTNLSVKPDDLGLILKDISINLPDRYEKITNILKSADNALSKAGLFSELGSDLQDEGTIGAWDKIEKSAIEIAKNEGITQAEAVTKVLKEHPELYKEYLSERSVK